MLNKEIRADRPETYEEAFPLINAELAKRSYKWQLTALPYLDYDDVCQIIRKHIYNKFSQYDRARSFLPWCNRIISSQIKNILRNIYFNFQKPCVRCIHNQEDGHCDITPSGTQCEECPLYLAWSKGKKNAYNIKMPVSMENHEQEVFNQPDSFHDDEAEAKKLSVRLKLELKPNEWKVYDLLYVQHKDECDAVVLLGFKNNDAGRQKGYKLIMKLRKVIIERAKKILKEGLD